MSDQIELSIEIKSRLDAISAAASELAMNQTRLQEDFQEVLTEVQGLYEEAAEKDEDGSDADELFSNDYDTWDRFDDIARNLGGQIGGEYESQFEFWVPSTC